MQIKLLKVLLLILIIAAIVVATLIGTKFNNESVNERELKEIIASIQYQEDNSTEIVPTIDVEIDGTRVVGIIRIPKINLEYPILERTDTETLNRSLTKFWGNRINEIGNVAIAGHNNLSGRFFGRLNNLEIGDKIELVDAQNVELIYEVFDIFVTNPDDISVVFPVEEGTREITLITCINGNVNRLIVRAREINR